MTHSVRRFFGALLGRPQIAREGSGLGGRRRAGLPNARKRITTLGLKPLRRRICALAHGSKITFKITVAEVEFMGEAVDATVIYGTDDAETILGLTAHESVGIEVDRRSQRLKRLPKCV